MTVQSFTNLRNILAELYPDEESMRRLMADAGINVTRIKLTSTPVNNWHAILAEAEKLGNIDALLAVLLGEYGENPSLQEAASVYLKSLIQPRPQNPRVKFVQTVRRRWLWIGAVIFALLPFGWLALKQMQIGPIVVPTPAPFAWGTLPPTNPLTGTTWTDAKFGITFVYVPAGAFLMGSTPEQIDVALTACQQFANDCYRDVYLDEAPQHTVMLDAFWIMQTEVTNAQYQKCVDGGPCTSPDNDNWNKVASARYPVTHIDWAQAKAYASWVGGQLPTEAQWEKAARGTDGRIYPWGYTWDSSRLNYCDSKCAYPWKDASVDDDYAETAPVGSYPNGVSPYGALDMAGNVWEWTTDWYVADYYATSPAYNPPGPVTGEARTARGGSWYNQPDAMRVAQRDKPLASFNRGLMGFRVIRAVSPDQ
jgi:formylglycine-generating enzyme required for sulfatase activity